MRLSPERAEYEFYIYDPNASVAEEELVSYHVYPNPSKNIIHITSPSVTQMTCVLYSLSGQRILEKDASTNSISIDISELKAGMYILKINNQITKIVKE